MFISHVPVLNFAGTALHITPRMCANPEPTFQRYTTKAQTLRFSSHTSVLNFAGTALHVTPRMCANPSSSLFWTLPEQITPRMCANPSWTNVQRHTTNPQTPRFHLTHPCFELCRSSSPYYTTHVCQPWTNVPEIHHKSPDPKIFISHICFELCQNSSPYYTRHVSQPILNQRPKTHYKLQIWKCSSHASLLWTLPEQITPRMCANPSWTNVPKIHHKTSDPKTQFCKPILIQPPKIYLSKFQCSPYRRQKCRALQEDTVAWKLVCDLQAKNGSQ